MSRCIFCGYCELACPFDAITLGNEFELSEYNRDDQIYTKDMLLAPPVKTGAGRRPRALRHADPLLPVRLVSDRTRGERRQHPRLGRLGDRRLRVPRVRRRGRLVLESVLLGARADRQPRLARRPLPAALGGVRRRRAGARLRGRGDGDVPLRDRVRRAAAGDAVAGRAELADARRGARRGRDLRRDHRRARAQGRRARSRSRTSRQRDVRLAGLDRPALPHRPPARIRDHVDRAADRGRRRRHPRRAHEAARATAPWSRRRDAGVGRSRGRASSGTSASPLPLRDRRARRARPPQPADRAALARDHAERREPRADRVRAQLGQRRGTDLRARRDGGRRVRGVRRPRPRRRAPPRRLPLDVDKLSELRG